MNKKVEIFKDLTNFPSDEFLHINSCGFTRDRKETRIYRPCGRVDVFICLVRNGVVSAEIDRERLLIKEGEVLVFLKNEPQDYTHIPDPVVETCWIHFCGKADDEIIKKAGISRSGRYLPSSPAETERLFRATIRHHLAGDELSAIGYLLRLISSVSPLKEKADSEVRRLIRREAEGIAARFTREIDLDEAAARCNISRSRFTHLFTETMGISPRRMQTELRIEKARELLAYSDLTVAEIAEQCGYGDPLYFSRIFAGTVGVSPSHFRKGFKR